MDMSSQINQLLNSFSTNYTRESAPEMFRYRLKTKQDTINQIREFEALSEEEDIPMNMILYLLNYIATDPLIESFINECIAPYVQNDFLGRDPAEEFYRSIEIYDQQTGQINETQGDGQVVVILTPIQMAASLIQNAYLFISDLVMEKKDIRDYLQDNIGIYDIYRYLIKLILIPIKEYLLYDLESDEGVPILIVSSLGTLSASFMKDHADEFLGSIKRNIIEQSKALLSGKLPDITNIENEDPNEMN